MPQTGVSGPAGDGDNGPSFHSRRSCDKFVQFCQRWKAGELGYHL